MVREQWASAAVSGASGAGCSILGRGLPAGEIGDVTHGTTHVPITQLELAVSARPASDLALAHHLALRP